MTPDARVQELLPCPFCGGQPRITGLHSVMCTDGICCAVQPTIAAWNRRSTPETERLRSALRHAVQSTHGHKPDACSACADIDSLLTPTRDPR